MKFWTACEGVPFYENKSYQLYRNNENNKLDVDNPFSMRKVFVTKYRIFVEYRIAIFNCRENFKLFDINMLKMLYKKWARVPILTRKICSRGLFLLGKRDGTLLRIVATRSIVEVSTLFVRFALVFRFVNFSVRRREEKIRNEKRVKFA